MTAGIWTARGLAFLGFLDAVYLTATHYAGGAVACGPGGGCETVLASRFATLGDLPIAAIGVAYYALASLVAWTPATSWSRATALFLAGLAGLAVAVSGVLFWIQATILEAWCRFCLVSAAVTLVLFACALALVRAMPALGDQDVAPTG